MNRLPKILSSALLLAAAVSAHAQISLQTAVDLAILNNPRVKVAQADAAKAHSALAQTHDAYIPSLTAGAGLGESYGYSFNPPTLFTFNAGSLVYSAAQFSYIRSARAGLSAADLALADVREAVAEDTALTFIALDHDQRREAVLSQQSTFAERLVNIVSQRYDAGQDTLIDVTTSKLTAAQLNLTRLRAQDETEIDRVHLQRIIGIPIGPLRAEGGFPTVPLPPDLTSQSGAYANSAVASAFANANAKQQLAIGDAKFLYRPQVSLVIEYNRYATFTNSFKQLQNQYRNSNGSTIGADEEVIGVSITVPLFDRTRRDKARATAADARHALHDAENAQINVLDAQSRLTHTIAELKARTEVASLEQQLAEQQLAVLQVQLTAPTGTGPLMTPRDEQNQHISERDKYLGVVDTTFQLQQAEINLLRQTGRLEEWLHQATLATIPTPSPSLQPIP